LPRDRNAVGFEQGLDLVIANTREAEPFDVRELAILILRSTAARLPR
jgi:hypothetical protein